MIKRLRKMLLDACALRRVLAILMIVLLASAGAWASQTALTVVHPVGPYITGQPGAGTLNFTFTACDAVNGNSFPITGREILIVENSSGTTAYTFTISSVADQYGRTNDVTTYSLAANAFATFSFRNGTAGWQQPNGLTYLACSNAAILFAVLSLSS